MERERNEGTSVGGVDLAEVESEMLGELPIVELEGSFGEDCVDVGRREREQTVPQPRFFHRKIHHHALAVRGR